MPRERLDLCLRVRRPLHTTNINTVSHSDDLSIAAGSSAELVASQINAIAKDNGVMARASTRVEFFGPTTFWNRDFFSRIFKSKTNCMFQLNYQTLI